jgi:hypothetical protein
VVTVTNARPGTVAVQTLGEGMASRPLLCPFDLQVWAVDRMLNFEIVDDPICEGLELQVFDDPAVVGGTWTARRSGDRVDLVLDVTCGWRPKGLPLLMAAVTQASPVFRNWPTTYRWTATVTLGNERTLRSRWGRKGDRRDQSYRRLTA